MTKRKSMTPGDARKLLQDAGVWLWGKDYHTLRSSEVDKVLGMAKLYGYRKAKNAPGSTARMFWEFLQREKATRVRG